MPGTRRAPRPRRTGRIAVIVTVCVVALAAIAVGAVYFFGNRSGSGPDSAADDGSTASTTTRPTVADPQLGRVQLALAPATNGKTAPTPAGVKKALEPILKNPAMGGNYAGVVMDAASGKVLWQQDRATPQLPASSIKLLMGTALLSSLKSTDQRMATTVVEGTTPGDIYFVGGGDVTLSARQTGTETVYNDPPTVAELAAQVRSSGVQVKRIILDTSYWTGEALAPGWDPADIKGGYITRMQPLMVDADRQDPSNQNSPRTGTPALTAGKALARALGNADLPVIDDGSKAPEDGRLLARVYSQPLPELLAEALTNSDNILAEALAREMAGNFGAPRSFEGASSATVLALNDLKLDTSQLTVADASGMSVQDRVTPELEAQVLRLAVLGKKDTLRYLLSGLPVGGVSGTLDSDDLHNRFTTPQAKAGAGWVRAKTGSINSTYVLSGYVPTQEGRMLVFSLFNNGVIPDAPSQPGTRAVQDAFATVLRNCGCRG